MLSIVFRLTCCFSGTTSRLWTFSSKLTLTTLSVVTSGPCSTLVFSLSSIFSSTFLLFSSSSCFLFASSASNLQHVCFVFCGFLQLITNRRQINGLRGLLGLVLGRFTWVVLVVGLLFFSSAFFFEASFLFWLFFAWVFVEWSLFWAKTSYRLVPYFEECSSTFWIGPLGMSHWT